MKMTKITRTIVHKTVFSGYVNTNPSDIKTFEVEGTVADPCIYAKKQLKLGKSDSFVVTDYKEEKTKYSMDLTKFIENAEVEG